MTGCATRTCGRVHLFFLKQVFFKYCPASSIDEPGSSNRLSVYHRPCFEGYPMSWSNRLRQRQRSVSTALACSVPATCTPLADRSRTAQSTLLGSAARPCWKPVPYTETSQLLERREGKTLITVENGSFTAYRKYYRSPRCTRADSHDTVGSLKACGCLSRSKFQWPTHLAP